MLPPCCLSHLILSVTAMFTTLPFPAPHFQVCPLVSSSRSSLPYPKSLGRVLSEVLGIQRPGVCRCSRCYRWLESVLQGVSPSRHSGTDCGSHLVFDRTMCNRPTSKSECVCVWVYVFVHVLCIWVNVYMCICVRFEVMFGISKSCCVF